MLITRRSPLTGEDTTLDLPVTDDQLRRHASGELIQDVFPDLTPAQREFIKTGYTAEDWMQMFPGRDGEQLRELSGLDYPGVASLSAGLVAEIQSVLWGIVDSCPGSPNCMNSPCYASSAFDLLRKMGVVVSDGDECEECGTPLDDDGECPNGECPGDDEEDDDIEEIDHERDIRPVE